MKTGSQVWRGVAMAAALTAALTAAPTAAPTAAMTVHAANTPAKDGKAHFSNTIYDDQDSVKPEATDGKPTPVTYANPVLPGFYPDPSITRAGDDYYLINSTFAFYPGIPVFHSKDLFHWEQIGNAIDRPGMLDFSGLATSRGVFAPDISYHDGTFYIVNTCVDCKGNFVITAKDPKGPWSDPVWLPFGGIDPSIFWDDDGKAYIVSNGPPEGEPLYQGHCALWLQQFDPATLTMTGPRQVVVNGGVDISKKPIWIEGPHLFRKDGRYYLMAAEGGTEKGHSEVIFRSDKIWGPYLPYGNNPILTQRDLDPARPDPVDSSGHADLVEGKDGQWWSVFLATRPYAPQADNQGLFNTGRETFMLPVQWKDGWPVILPHGQAIPRAVTIPGAPTISGYGHATNVGFSKTRSPLEWLQVRTPGKPFLKVGNGLNLTLTPLNEPIGDVTSHPAFIGLRQGQPKAVFVTTLTYRPKVDGDRAGILALQSDDFYVFYGLAMKDGKDVIQVTRRAGKTDPRDGVVVAQMPIAPAHDRITLVADIKDGKARFTYHLPGKPGKVVAENVDVTNLSTTKAGGFVGTVIGLYAYGQKP